MVADFPDQLVEIDKMRTQQIFINLVGNAIKFSKPRDRITVEICRPEAPDFCEANEDRVTYTFKVTDQGIGLNETDRRNLFKPYFKSTCEVNRNANSSSNGIGLYVSKRMAQLLEGDLFLSEEYKTGCQFVLQMNLKRLEMPQMMQTYRVRGARFGKKKRQKKDKFKEHLSPIFELPQEYMNSR